MIRANREFKKQLISRAYRLALDGIKTVESLPNKRVIWVPGDQFLRSITSIGANIVEAQAASSKKDFINFLTYALKSANETKFWIGLMRDSGYLDKETADNLLNETEELCKILGSSILRLKGKKA